MRRLLGLEEVAECLRLAPDTFRRRWRAMVREHGFPDEFPGRHLHWDPRALELWQDRFLGLAQIADTAPAPPEADEDDLREVLRARARAIAGRDAAE